MPEFIQALVRSNSVSFLIVFVILSLFGILLIWLDGLSARRYLSGTRDSISETSPGQDDPPVPHIGTDSERVA